MKKLFVMLALAWGTMGAFAQTETDSAAVVNKGITPRRLWETPLASVK